MGRGRWPRRSVAAIDRLLYSVELLYLLRLRDSRTAQVVRVSLAQTGTHARTGCREVSSVHVVGIPFPSCMWKVKKAFLFYR